MMNPKVFISYSHDTQEHKDWVRFLAETLIKKGISVILDQFDLNLGQDILQFMAESIQKADRVLVVCTEQYVKKAYSGNSGTRIETMIINNQIAKNQETTKFIPIVRQRGKGDPFPIFLSNRLYLDFQDDAKFEERIQDLIHDIYGQKKNPKPALVTNAFQTLPTTSENQILEYGNINKKPEPWQNDINLIRDAIDFMHAQINRPSLSTRDDIGRFFTLKTLGSDAELQKLRFDWFRFAEATLVSYVGKREAIAIYQAGVQMYNESFKYKDFDINNQQAHIAESDLLHDHLISQVDNINDVEIRDQLKKWLQISKHNMGRRYQHLKW